MPRCIVPALAIALMLAGTGASAHDPSAYGGLFRSRDLGGTWLNADVGLFLNSALAVAVNPRDPNHLLLGTDLGLMRSQTGGRSWTPEAQGQIIGAVFALAFTPDGQSAVCAAPSGVFRFQDGQWLRADAPGDAAPARVLAVGAVPGRIYMLGRDGLFASNDGGQSYDRVASGLPQGAEIAALAVAQQRGEILLAVVDRQIMASEDGGRQWQRRARGSGRHADRHGRARPVVAAAGLGRRGGPRACQRRSRARPGARSGSPCRNPARACAASRPTPQP